MNRITDRKDVKLIAYACMTLRRLTNSDNIGYEPLTTTER